MIKLYFLPNSELMLAKEKLRKSCHFREYLLEPRLFVDQTGTGVIRMEVKVMRSKVFCMHEDIDKLDTDRLCVENENCSRSIG